MSNSITPEEAIKILDPDCKEVWQGGKGVDACRLAVKALKYRTPKKPLAPISKLLEMGRCPNCNAALFDKNLKFCGDCGQALDWSDEE